MAANKKTSPAVAAIAARLLPNKKTSASVKKVVASALSQAAGKSKKR